jgi:hypothetical protein
VRTGEPPVSTPLLVKQLLDAAQRATQGPWVGTGPAQRKGTLEFGDHRIRCHEHRWRSMLLGDTRHSVDQAKRAIAARGVSWSSIGRVFKSRPLRQLSL